ncbi:hypothetical protein Tco_0427434 [Tanacetum coccineum]
MAVTHADLAPSRRGTNIGSKTGVVLIVFSILLGLLCFVLCLMAEATRSQTIRDVSDDGGGETDKSEFSKSDPDPSLLMTWEIANDHLSTLTWQAAFFFITTWIFFQRQKFLLQIGLSWGVRDHNSLSCYRFIYHGFTSPMAITRSKKVVMR